MATVLFWAKPGCVNNMRQQNLLRDAGHEVLERNLLTEPWDVVRLRRFFGTLPVAAWFNGRSAAVKQGLILPDALSEAQALRLMVADPILIRRPLMKVGECYMAGFDPVRVDAWIGLGAYQETSQALETCPRNLVQAGR